ncbi:LCP family protein [Brachyspira pilosicoli]|uniref:LCP family protein n=1 Tax=Brachyspira pilosicoli TaxID=52584 RepID=UPI001C676C56|nr:LCP family protein [Brachyspira pilosicoli]MBW5396437.1 LytR family transcriptional regulator [Brachyspira pilosicoli]
MKIKNNDNNTKALKTISNANKKAVIILISSFIFIIIAVTFILYYFLYSKIDSAIKKDEELYFSVLFIDENNEPYGAYVGTLSSLHNRIGLIGLPRNVALWKNKKESPIPLKELYKEGGDSAVFNAIENTVNKKITYKITLDNNSISDIIDLIGGVKMYVEEPIHYVENDSTYNINFDIGEWIFHGNKVVSYLHYVTMKQYEDIETLYRLEDVIINLMISFIQSPELKSMIVRKDMRNAIYSKIKSNLRPPDIKAILKIISNSNEKSLIVQNIDARVDDKGILNPLLGGSAFVKQMEDLSLYVGLKTERSELNNEDVSLIILNGTDVSGLADRINIRMRYRGFAAGEYGNFPAKVYNSIVLIRNGEIEKSFMVANECRISRIYAKTDRRLLNNAVLILGYDYYEIQ